MPRAVLGLGGNLGARRALLRCARALLEAQPGLSVRAASRMYHTPPLGPPQPDYLNAALLVDWVGSARSLLTLAQHVEALLLRQRAERWGARTLDLDLLHWSEGPIRARDLVVPHPELARRPFAWVPLLDVAPELEASLGLSRSKAEPSFAVSEAFEPVWAGSNAAAPAADGSWADTPARVRPEGYSFVSAEAQAEPLELLCAWVEARVMGSAPVRSSATLPFRCALPGSSPESLAAAWRELEQRVVSSQKYGFSPQKAAITAVNEGGCLGVFIGARGTLDPAHAPSGQAWIPVSPDGPPT